VWRVASVAAGAEGRQGRAGVSMVTSERLLMFYRPPGSHPLSQLSMTPGYNPGGCIWASGGRDALGASLLRN
jgi:hypothetical protein